MMTRHYWALTAAVTAILAAIAISTGQSLDNWAKSDDDATQAADQDVLARGPIHEAFAEPVLYDPKPTIIAPSRPPEAINELPPDQAPDDERAIWLPGYWYWDDESNDFMWVSGCWRIPPAGYEWVPGYWQEVDDGWQWVSGRWQQIGAAQPEYLPDPPESLDLGPNSTAPSDDMVWVPGRWAYAQDRYDWSAGYWLQSKPDRIWVPRHYIWTPRSCLLVGGYWDYPMDGRGVLFAPVHFSAPILKVRNFTYSPIVVVNISVMGGNLFCRPSGSHYYFGDYYASSYVTRGYFPWSGWQVRHRWYDPIYLHEQWRHRKDDPQWDRHQKDQYENRRDDRSARPARTMKDLQTQLAKTEVSKRKDLEIAQPLPRIVSTKVAGFKFEKVTKDRREQLIKQAKDVQTAAKNRPLPDKPISRPTLDQAKDLRTSLPKTTDPRRTEVIRPADPRNIDKGIDRKDTTPRTVTPVKPTETPRTQDSDTAREKATWANRPLPAESKTLARPGPKSEVAMPKDHRDSVPLVQPRPSVADTPTPTVRNPAPPTIDVRPTRAAPPAEVRPVIEPRRIELPAPTKHEPAPLPADVRPVRVDPPAAAGPVVEPKRVELPAPSHVELVRPAPVDPPHHVEVSTPVNHPSPAPAPTVSDDSSTHGGSTGRHR